MLVIYLQSVWIVLFSSFRISGATFNSFSRVTIPVFGCDSLSEQLIL